MPFTPIPNPPPPQPDRALYPIRAVLPGVEGAYTENWVVFWLLTLWEAQAAEDSRAMEDFFTLYMDPYTCVSDALDWLAQLAGYTGVYWNAHWPDRAKRLLIAEAYVRVWPGHGTAALLEWLWETFELDVDMRVGGSPFRTDNSASLTDRDPLGGGLSRFDLRLPNDATSAQWDLVERLTILFSPVWVPLTISYRTFRTDISRTEQVLSSS